MPAATISIAKAAKYLGVSSDTLRRWEKIGRIRAYRSPSGQRYFLQSDLDQAKYGHVLTTAKAAAFLGVSASTLRRMTDEGRIIATVGANGYRSYKIEHLQRINPPSNSPINPVPYNPVVVAPSSPVYVDPTPPTPSLTPNQKHKHRTYQIALIAVLVLSLLGATAWLRTALNSPKTLSDQAMQSPTYYNNSNVLGLSITSPLTQPVETVRQLANSALQFLRSVLLPEDFDKQLATDFGNGTDGATGATGPRGSTGIFGRAGVTGATGSTGPKGDSGTNGSNGDGEDGEDGVDGVDGATGATGPGGSGGDSIFQEANNLLFPGPVVSRSLALGNINDNESTTTSTSSARIYLDAISGDASLSGSLTLGAYESIRSQYGPLQFDYKSGLDSYSSAMYIQDGTGNIGLGTTNPSNNFHIFDAGVPEILLDRGHQKGHFFKAASTTTMLSHNINWNGSQYNLDSSGIDGWLMTFGDRVGGTRFDIAYAPDTSTAGFTPTSFFRINGSQGLIGINTTTPASRLDVHGGYAGNAAVTVNQTLAGDIFTASTSGTTQFVIKNDGNVGVGTTNPQGKFHIYGEAIQPLSIIDRSTNGSGAGGTLFRRSRSGETSLIANDHIGSTYYQMRNSNSEYVNSLQFTAFVEDPTDGSEDAGLFLYTINDGSYTEKLRINSLGLVGLNTTAPASRLDVQGGYAGNAAVTVNQMLSGDIFTASASGTTRLVIKNDGKVGIGTATPQTQAEVIGGYLTVADAESSLTGRIYFAKGAYGYGGTWPQYIRGNAGDWFFTGLSGEELSLDLNNSESGISNYQGDFNLNANASTKGIEFRTQGVARGYLNSSGSLGIGTTDPLSRLDVQGGYAGNAAVTVNQTLAGDIFTASASGTTQFVIKNDGSVGIGTGNPSYNLDVVGAGGSSDAVGRITANGGQDAHLIISGGSTSKRSFASFQSSTNAYAIGVNGADTFEIADGTLVGTNTRFLIDSSGNIGINTTSPTSKLDVQGGYAGNAAVTVNQTLGGDILTASASGTTRFTLANDGSVTHSTTDTTGTAYTLNTNSITTGTGLSLASTSNSFSTGYLQHISWSPTSTTNATGDLLRLSINSSANIGNFFNIVDNGSSLFAISESAVTSNIPVNFAAPGDVSLAYDLLFTNQTASYIRSNASLYLEAGETFESNDLVMRTYNYGNIVAELPPNGKFVVGSASSSGVLKFTVQDHQESTAAAIIQNTGTGIDADGLVIKLDHTGNSNVNNAFITFMNGLGNVHGRITGDNATGVQYQTTGIDFAEYFVKDIAESFQTGDIVSLNPTTGKTTKTTTQADPNLLGIVSANPGFTGGTDGPDKVLVAIVGQVPIRIARDSAPIRVGDFITSSGSVGQGKKATQPGQMIAKALEPWQPGGPETIMVFVSNVWADPQHTTTGTLTTLERHEDSLASIQDTLQHLATASSSLPVETPPTLLSTITDTVTSLLVHGQALIEGSLEVLADLRVAGMSSFVGRVLFGDEVEFPTDTAGKAIITAYATQIDIPFSKPFTTTPVVTISLALSEASDSAFLADGVQAAVAEVTPDGFSIVLNSPVPRDLAYHWHAFISTDTRTVQGTLDATSLDSTDASVSAAISQVQQLLLDLQASASGQVAATSSAHPQP